jgi:hypothetical protein
MPQAVSDFSSNAPEQIAHAAKTVGRSEPRRKVFAAIYTGKKRIKTVPEISRDTGLSEKRVVEHGKKLSDNHVVNPTKIGGRRAYEKIDSIHTHKKRILALAASTAKLKAFPTKRNPAQRTSRTVRIRVDLQIPRQKAQARLVTVDDIGSFSKVRSIRKNCGYTRISESVFKDGIANILGEKGRFKDWGGENRDLSSTRVVISGKRHAAAFAFKGPGKTGSLTPGKMGKNGDQIQRLVLRCPADVFFVQYWGQIDDSVLEQLENYAKYKSYAENRSIRYGIIDGIDSTRIITAYPKAFRK